jgi:hypothetical protein
MKKLLYFLPLIALISCNDISTLENENEKLKKQLTEIKLENDSLVDIIRGLLILNEELENKKQVEITKQKNQTQGLLYNGSIKVVTTKTGYDPYNNDKLWLPSITLMFENVSNNTIDDMIEIKAIFIDNSKKEQLSEDYQLLTTSSRPFISQTKKQITLKSNVGWYFVDKQDVSVHIFVDNVKYKTFKIKNEEFTGRI